MNRLVWEVMGVVFGVLSEYLADCGDGSEGDSDLEPVSKEFREAIRVIEVDTRLALEHLGHGSDLCFEP